MRLLPLTADIILSSTALAGIRRAGNFDYPIDEIQSTGLRWIASQFLFIGELVLDLTVSMTHQHPQIFKPKNVVMQKGNEKRFVSFEDLQKLNLLNDSISIK